MALPPPFRSDLKVLVLAGTDEVDPRRRRRDAARIARGRREVPLEDKAFLPLRGRLVIEYVLDSLEALEFGRTWVLARRQCLKRLPARYRFTPLAQPPGATMAVNLAAAYAALTPEPDEPVLAIFGDHPLTTPAVIADFLGRCAPQLQEADFFHGVALEEAYAAYAPYFRRTSVHMREMAGRASGLNLIVPSRLHRLSVFDHIYAVRKLERPGRFFSLLVRTALLLRSRAPSAVLDSVRLYLAKEFEKLSRRAGRLGRLGAAVTAWLARQVPTARIEAYAARLLAAERGIRLVPLAHGGAAIDVDFAEELAVLERHWEQIAAIAHRQEAASQQQPVYRTGTSSVSRYVVR